MVEFQRLNLIEAFPPAKPFQVIFCRNVMIYFDKETQGRLVNRFVSCLEPGGYLLIGHSESLAGLTHPYEYIKPAVYRRPM
jgi:chemotaxis protein methyltransferase CheR